MEILFVGFTKFNLHIRAEFSLFWIKLHIGLKILILLIDCKSRGGKLASREDEEVEEQDDNYDQVATRKGHDDDGEYDEYVIVKD